MQQLARETSVVRLAKKPAGAEERELGKLQDISPETSELAAE